MQTLGAGGTKVRKRFAEFVTLPGAYFSHIFTTLKLHHAFPTPALCSHHDRHDFLKRQFGSESLTTGLDMI